MFLSTIGLSGDRVVFMVGFLKFKVHSKWFLLTDAEKGRGITPPVIRFYVGNV
ncbi:hypothetical protein D3C71_1946260 [compost metagenome]